MEPKQLSLVAQYDDLVRFGEILIGGDQIEDKMRRLLENCQKQRIQWLSERNELIELRKQYSEALKDVNRLKTTLKNVRAAFAQEVTQRERARGERDDLLKKLNQVKEYLIEEDPNKSILSSLNLHKLTTVTEEDANASDKSLSDIDFSKTNDNIRLDDHSFDRDPPNLPNVQHVAPVLVERMDTAPPVFENEDEFQSLSNHSINLSDERFTTPVKRTPSVQSKISTFSETLMKQRQNYLENEIKIENRPHQFVTKKVFRPEKCCVCATSLKFYSSGYHCRDCRAICHMTCKEGVPKPCIPYVSRANIGKQGRLILVSDFVQSNCKPCVPALIVHCLNEIDKRGLEEVGVYRICASEKDVRELKEKILKSKAGIPQLADEDVHVLCNVVKKFLNQLDEALISRIAWRDFVEAVKEPEELKKLRDQKDHRAQSKAIELEQARHEKVMEAIENLPNANRDTLAFLILHLIRVRDEPKNKMTDEAICRVFGPTILGYSMKDPPAMQMHEEHKKQQQVVEYLLTHLDEKFWKAILNTNSNPLKFSSTINPSTVSLGSRLCGGKVNSGTMTPLKNLRSDKNYNIKPLF